MKDYWNKCLNNRVSESVDYDIDLKKVITDYCFDYEDCNPDYPKQYPQIVGVIMSTFKTSYSAISEDNRELLEKTISDLVDTFESVEEVV